MDAPIEVHPGIFVIENFISQEEVNEIVTVCEAISDEEWDARMRSAFGIHEMSFAAEMEGRFKEVFDPEQYMVRNFNKIQRREPGESEKIAPHYARKHEDERCLMSAIVHVNDNYEGGELNFVLQNFIYKPNSGSLIYFPATEEYQFSINSVTSDVHRYAIPESVYIAEPEHDRPSLAVNI